MAFPGHFKSLYLHGLSLTARGEDADNQNSKDWISCLTASITPLTQPNSVKCYQIRLNAPDDNEVTGTDQQETGLSLNETEPVVSPRARVPSVVESASENVSPPALRRYDSYRPVSRRDSTWTSRDERETYRTISHYQSPVVDHMFTRKHENDTSTTPNWSRESDGIQNTRERSSRDYCLSENRNESSQSHPSTPSERQPFMDAVRIRQDSGVDKVQPTSRAELGFKGLESVLELASVSGGHDKLKFRTKSPGERLRGGNDETGSCITDMTNSSRSSLSRRKICSGCKESETALVRLVPCSTCPRRYHATCGNPRPPADASSTFVCGSCLKKAKALNASGAETTPRVFNAPGAAATPVSTDYLHTDIQAQHTTARTLLTTNSALSPPSSIIRDRRRTEIERNAEATRKRYKEEVTCNFWLLSSCQRRPEDCIFAHHRTSVIAPTGKHPAPVWTCYRWWKTGSCPKTSCLYAHIDTGLYIGPDEKASKRHVYCYWMAKTGSCSKRDNCLFSHVDTGILANEPPETYAARGWRTVSASRSLQQDRYIGEDGPTRDRVPEPWKNPKDDGSHSRASAYSPNHGRPAEYRTESGHPPVMPRSERDERHCLLDEVISTKLSSPTHISTMPASDKKEPESPTDVFRQVDMSPVSSQNTFPDRPQSGSTGVAVRAEGGPSGAPYRRCLECLKIIFSSSEVCLRCARKPDVENIHESAQTTDQSSLQDTKSSNDQVLSEITDAAVADEVPPAKTAPVVMTRKRPAFGTSMFAPEKRIKTGGGVPLVTNYPISEALKRRSSTHRVQFDMLDQSRGRIETITSQQDARPSETGLDAGRSKNQPRTTRSTGVQTSSPWQQSHITGMLASVSPTTSPKRTTPSERHCPPPSEVRPTTGIGVSEVTRETVRDKKIAGTTKKTLQIPVASTVVLKLDPNIHNSDDDGSRDGTENVLRAPDETRRRPCPNSKNIHTVQCDTHAIPSLAMQAPEQDGLPTSIARLVKQHVRFEPDGPSDDEAEMTRDTAVIHGQLKPDSQVRSETRKISKGQGLKGKKGVPGNSLILRRQMKQNMQLYGSKHTNKASSSRPSVIKASVVREEAVTFDEPPSNHNANPSQTPVMREFIDEVEMTILEFLGITKETKYEHGVVKQALRVKGCKGQPAQLLEKIALVLRERLPVDSTNGSRTRRNIVRPRVWVVGGSERIIGRART